MRPLLASKLRGLTPKGQLRALPAPSHLNCDNELSPAYSYRPICSSAAPHVRTPAVDQVDALTLCRAESLLSSGSLFLRRKADARSALEIGSPTP